MPVSGIGRPEGATIASQALVTDYGPSTIPGSTQGTPGRKDLGVEIPCGSDPPQSPTGPLVHLADSGRVRFWV